MDHSAPDERYAQPFLHKSFGVPYMRAHKKSWRGDCLAPNITSVLSSSPPLSLAWVGLCPAHLNKCTAALQPSRRSLPRPPEAWCTSPPHGATGRRSSPSCCPSAVRRA